MMNKHKCLEYHMKADSSTEKYNKTGIMSVPHYIIKICVSYKFYARHTRQNLNMPHQLIHAKHNNIVFTAWLTVANALRLLLNQNTISSVCFCQVGNNCLANLLPSQKL